MWKNLTILAVLALIIALPFIFRHEEGVSEAGPGDPVLIIISPHNEAIRYEFALAFSRWHEEKYGQPVRIDWRNIGGTTEISRYLQGEFSTSAKAWWEAQGKRWPVGGTDAVVNSRPPASPDIEPKSFGTFNTLEEWQANQKLLVELYNAYRQVDDPTKITSKVDLFFGGGQYDHSNAFARGFGVAPWDENNLPADVAASLAMIPKTLGGELWRTATLFGNAVSTFGIVYNVDRLKELNVTTPPAEWDDLADFRYFKQVGVTDPTKSGSIAKAFEMLVHQKMHDAARDHLKQERVPDEQIDARIAANEKEIDAYKASLGKNYKRGDVPDHLKAYQASLEQGWLDGIFLIQAIGGNARYFTDSATKVSIDVSMGDAAVGMSIDFYGRYQAQTSRAPDGSERMLFVTPVGGTSVSCDPITLLRGAPTREVATRFIEFVLSEEGQRLWTYAPGTVDASGNLIGPAKYALRRLPIRRDFYPSTQPAIEARHIEHKQHAVDDLTDPNIDPYQLARQFTYYKRWTDEHFGVMRNLTRAMCMDSGEELRDAWARLHRPITDATEANTTNFARPIRQLPTITLDGKTLPLNWRTAPDFNQYDSLDVMREWTRAFRELYKEAGRPK
jgi:iron(III) transport system substrate-binding protein